VPNDGKRDVPDVSLFAGDGLNASFYLVCETDIYGGCAGEIETLVGVGGTSASAPTFAGITAMVNQKTQSRQGNANYVLYPLAAQPDASCNSTGTIESSCIFHDVTMGTIAMPCVTGSPDCVTNVASDRNGVLSGYTATTGYDLATGAALSPIRIQA
jgi:subtilase family serine protease